MRIRIFLLFLCLACCGGALRAQQKAFRAKPAEINSSERGALVQSLKSWKVFSLEGLNETLSASTSEIVFEWGSSRLRFPGRHVPLGDQQTRVIEIGKGYRLEHAFPQLLQFRGKGIRMTIGKDFILGEYTAQGRKYIVEQLGHFMPGSDASKVVVYDTEDIIDQRPSTCGAESPAHRSAQIALQRETSQPRDKVNGACRIVDVAVMANSTSYREHGSSVQETAAYIASIYSLTEGDYTSAFTDDFRFHITEIVVSTSADTDPWMHTDDIHRNLDNFWNFAMTEFRSPHDLSSYWFRTQNFNGGVIGLAYMGFTCNTVGDAAIREFGGSAQIMRCLLSHEIGHNFNMSHDAAGSGFIMAPSIIGSKEFSAASKSSFEIFVGSGSAACITECNVDDCERRLVTDVRASMEAEGRTLRATWKKSPGSQGYIVRWWERGSNTVMTRQVDSLTEEVLISLECSDASFYRVEVALVCSNGRPGTYTGLDIANAAVPRIMVEGLDMICPGTSTKIRSSLAGGNQWLRDGQPITGATGQELVVTEPGSYTVRAISAGGCTYVSNELFIVRNLSAQRPRLSADGPTEFCDGSRVVLNSTAADRYQWLRDGVEIPGEQGRSLSARSSGAYTVRVETADRCIMVSDTIRVQSNPLPDSPSVLASRVLELCPGDSIQFQISAASGIQWYRNDTVIAGAVSPIYITVEQGSYRVQVTNQFNCRSTSVVQVVSLAAAPPKPMLTASGATSVCEGNIVNLQTDATANMQWLLDGTEITSAVGRSNLFAERSGAYLVRVSNAAGCTTSSDTIRVTVFENPARPPINWNGTELSTLAGFKTYRWLKDGIEVPGALTNTYRPTTAGNYQTAVTNINDCPAVSESYPLVITGLQDVVIAGASVQCFPNPARDAVHLRVVGTNPVQGLAASLIDMHGRHISRQNLLMGVNRFETGHLAAGLYFLLVTDGKERQVIKFVISR